MGTLFFDRQGPLAAPATAEDSADDNQEGWMVSYADMVTLLLIFFAVMLSVSTVNQAKLDALSNVFNKESRSSLSQIQHQLDAEIKKGGLNSVVRTSLTPDGLQVAFDESVLFPSGSAGLNDNGRTVMGSFSGILAKMELRFKVAVEGHTDDHPIHNGQFKSNWDLSATRAVEVLRFLTQNGVDSSRLMVRAYADTRPLEQPAAGGVWTEAQRAKNRRVNLLVF